MRNLETVYRFSKILQIESIRKEVDRLIKGATLKDIKLTGGTWNCTLETKDGDIISLDSAMVEPRLIVYKSTQNKLERFYLGPDLIMREDIVERRPNGIIFTQRNKQFGPSARFGNEIVLLDLIENRMVFTNETLERLIENFDSNNSTISRMLLKFKILSNKIDLEEEADYHTSFETHMNYYANWNDGRKIKDNIYSTKTLLNGIDISRVFDVKDDKEKLYRVHDLFHGIINERNKEDICAMNLGLMGVDAYDYKTLACITKAEDKIVGESIIKDEEQEAYLRDLLTNVLGYEGEFEFNRNSIVEAILNRKYVSDEPKKQEEKSHSTNCRVKKIIKKLLNLD